jgi:hypothetical protein
MEFQDRQVVESQIYLVDRITLRTSSPTMPAVDHLQNRHTCSQTNALALEEDLEQRPPATALTLFSLPIPTVIALEQFWLLFVTRPQHVSLRKVQRGPLTSAAVQQL